MIITRIPLFHLLLVPAASGFFAFGVTACEDQSESEEAVEEIGDAVEEAGDEIDDSTN